jgi:hypothetical protein
VASPVLPEAFSPRPLAFSFHSPSGESEAERKSNSFFQRFLRVETSPHAKPRSLSLSLSWYYGLSLYRAAINSYKLG